MNEGYARELNLDAKRGARLYLGAKRGPVPATEPEADPEAEVAEPQPTGAVVSWLFLPFSLLALALWAGLLWLALTGGR